MEALQATGRDKTILNLYNGLMDEAKIRLSYLDSALSGRTGLPDRAVHEFSFLQLRYLCELIALSCLTAHGDIAGTSRLREEFAAGLIVTELGKLHPDFYPRPLKGVKTGPKSYHFAASTTDFLTKADLVCLNGKCGEHLHRGKAKKLFGKNSSLPTNFPEIVSYKHKIEKLLFLHHMSLTDGRQFLCMFRGQNEPVQSLIAEPLKEVDPTP